MTFVSATLILSFLVVGRGVPKRLFSIRLPTTSNTNVPVLAKANRLKIGHRRNGATLLGKHQHLERFILRLESAAHTSFEHSVKTAFTKQRQAGNASFLRPAFMATKQLEAIAF